MLGISTPVAFVATTDRERARAFYRDTLGLAPIGEDAFADVFALGPITLRLVGVGEFTPLPFTVLGWRVDDVDEIVAELTSRGVAFERYGMPEQDARGVWRSPSGTLVAWFKDPDGNTLSVSQG